MKDEELYELIADAAPKPARPDFSDVVRRIGEHDRTDGDAVNDIAARSQKHRLLGRIVAFAAAVALVICASVVLAAVLNGGEMSEMAPEASDAQSEMFASNNFSTTACDELAESDSDVVSPSDLPEDGEENGEEDGE